MKALMNGTELVMPILTDCGLTLEEYIDLCGGQAVNDERWSDDGDNVIFPDFGLRCWYEDLHVEDM